MQHSWWAWTTSEEDRVDMRGGVPRDRGDVPEGHTGEAACEFDPRRERRELLFIARHEITVGCGPRKEKTRRASPAPLLGRLESRAPSGTRWPLRADSAPRIRAKRTSIFNLTFGRTFVKRLSHNVLPNLLPTSRQKPPVWRQGGGKTPRAAKERNAAPVAGFPLPERRFASALARG